MEKCKAGIFIYALAFLLGIVLVQQFSVLPELSSLVYLLIAVLSLYLIYRYSIKKFESHFYKSELTLPLLLITLFILGIIYSSFYSKYQLSYQLDELYAGQNIVITGRVSSLPVISEKAQRFEFDVASHHLLQKKGAISQTLENFPKKLRLSWYYGAINADEEWQLEVRLKPPHGFMNPGGFDYEGWLFQHGIQATGYVRKSELNKRNKAAAWWSINKMRQSLSQQIDRLADIQTDAVTSISLVKALAIGDKSSISPYQWRVLTNTGTSHLMAISGLHIGLAALFSYLLIRRITPVFLMKRIPAQHVALLGSMVVALLYAMTAGLSIPTQRAIIMLFILSLMMLLRRNHRPVDSLGFALLVVLMVDPLAVLSAGFWFSFSAVAVIFISISDDKSGNTENVTVLSRLGFVIKGWVKLQLLISVFLLPLTLFMFQQASLVSPLANLLLIPYVSFLVVPVVLLAIVSSFVFQGISEQLFNLSVILLDFIWPALSFLSVQPYAHWAQGDVKIVELLLATVAMLLILFSRPFLRFLLSQIFNHPHKKSNHSALLWIFRSAACLFIIPLFVSDKQALDTGEYQLTILDVGQGSAAVIQTKNHVAVFDSGAKFSDKFDAGSGVVIPYLRSQGIRHLDRLIVSHGDADHIGGAPAILAFYPAVEVIGQDIEGLNTTNKSDCQEGQIWQWDGVDFAFLSPSITDVALSSSKKRNNRSCVLRISSKSGSVLFTGDIEKMTESELIEKYRDKLSSDVLIVPHHGSNTSSTQDFIQSVSPKVSVISAGYRNRYKLPSNAVLSRYEQANRSFMRTDKSGAITIKMDATDELFIESYRQLATKYWHHRLN